MIIIIFLFKTCNLQLLCVKIVGKLLDPIKSFFGVLAIMSSDGFKILIVDDSILNQEMLRLMLTSDMTATEAAGQAPYILEFAKTGPQALDMIAENKPDLILLDIVMPGMSGFDVLARLQENESTKSIPVIFITGLNDEANEERGLICGAVDYITRPFHKAIVLARIRTHRRIVEQMRLIELYSLIDPLTNIPNRRSFDFQMKEIWGRAARKKESVSVLIADVDFFKNYNDTYGHQQGDAALKVIANAITAALKRSSDMAFRWGGEEFTAVLVDTELEGAMLVAERIRESVESVPILDIGGGASHSITISVGVASASPGNDNNYAELIRFADMALYNAKKNGRNKVCSDFIVEKE